MQIMPLVELNSTPSIGSILGNTGSRDFLNSINQELSNGSGVYFGSAADQYKDHYKSFVDNVVMPTIDTAKIVRNTFNRVSEKERIICVNSIKQLEQGIPTSMELPILMYAPIKKMLQEETIYGFGYEYKNIEDAEDVYGRLIANGTVTLNGPDADEYMVSEWKSTDPAYSFDDLDNIEKTRQYIDSFLEEYEDMDFTDYGNPVGTIK